MRIKDSKYIRIIFSLILILSILSVSFQFMGKAYASDDGIVKEEKNPVNMKWAFISAAIVTGVATLSAAIAVGLVGSSAMGAMSERPEMAGRALIFVGLAEGIAIYGLIVAIMILGMV